jgi:threonine/homoserine/homoserine lactone efflux protein
MRYVTALFVVVLLAALGLRFSGFFHVPDAVLITLGVLAGLALLWRGYRLLRAAISDMNA